MFFQDLWDTNSYVLIRISFSCFDYPQNKHFGHFWRYTCYDWRPIVSIQTDSSHSDFVVKLPLFGEEDSPPADGICSDVSASCHTSFHFCHNFLNCTELISFNWPCVLGIIPTPITPFYIRCILYQFLYTNCNILIGIYQLVPISPTIILGDHHLIQHGSHGTAGSVL